MNARRRRQRVGKLARRRSERRLRYRVVCQELHRLVREYNLLAIDHQALFARQLETTVELGQVRLDLAEAVDALGDARKELAAAGATVRDALINATTAEHLAKHLRQRLADEREAHADAEDRRVAAEARAAGLEKDLEASRAESLRLRGAYDALAESHASLCHEHEELRATTAELAIECQTLRAVAGSVQHVVARGG